MKSVIKLTLFIVTLYSCGNSEQFEVQMSCDINTRLEVTPNYSIESIFTFEIDESIFEIEFFNEDHGFIISEKNERRDILSTFDGGRSWVIETNHLNQELRIMDIEFVDAQSPFAVYVEDDGLNQKTGLLQYSYSSNIWGFKGAALDGNILQIKSYDGFIYAVQHVDETERLIVTQDYGETWTSIYENPNLLEFSTYSMAKLDNYIYLSGQDQGGKIYKFNLNTSEVETIEIIGNLSWDFRVVSHQILYYQNKTGVFKTIDGGDNWEKIRNDDGYMLTIEDSKLKTAIWLKSGCIEYDTYNFSEFDNGQWLDSEKHFSSEELGFFKKSILNNKVVWFVVNQRLFKIK